MPLLRSPFTAEEGCSVFSVWNPPYGRTKQKLLCTTIISRFQLHHFSVFASGSVSKSSDIVTPSALARYFSS